MRGISSSRIAIIVSVFLLTIPAVSWAQSTALTLDQILSRMQQAEIQSRQESIAYTVTREFQLAPAGAPQPSSDVIAEVNFVPPAAKDYSIVKSEGNDRGAGIVRKILDHELEMVGHPERHEISRRNYDFALLGRESLDGHDCYVLQLTPKRQAVELVNGKAWVDANDFLIRQIQGATAKNPSMWIKDLKLTINYGQVNGIWVQTSTRAVAEVRFVGTHVLTSRELDVQPALLNAQMRAQWQSRQRRNDRHIQADTATWMAR